MATFLAFVLSSVFVFGVQSFRYCDFERNLGIWDSLNRSPCCEVSDEQWKLIEWYFAGINSHIDITEIVNKNRQSSFTNQFLEDLHEHTGLELRNYRVNYSYVEENHDINLHIENFFKWHPEELKNINSTYFVTDETLEIRHHIRKKNWFREDKPNKGVVVLATNANIIDKYLNHVARQPFIVKRAYYIMIVYRESYHDGHWDRHASNILAKLWKVHGILNAILFSTCKNSHVSTGRLISFLFPFFVFVSFFQPLICSFESKLGWLFRSICEYS